MFHPLTPHLPGSLHCVVRRRTGTHRGGLAAAGGSVLGLMDSGAGLGGGGMGGMSHRTGFGASARRPPAGGGGYGLDGV